MQPSEHPFDLAIALQPLDQGIWSGHTSEHYWNSISPYGGTTVATLLHAILQHPQRLGDPLSMTINFAGAIQKGPFTVHVRPARTGRATQHWTLELRQDGDPAPLITGTAVFAVRRDSWSDTESEMPDAPAPDSLPRAVPPVAVPFLQCYDMRYVDCTPLSANPHSVTQCWLGDVPPRRLDFPSLAAYCDAFVPRLFVRRGAPSPIATVTLGINFHVDADLLAREQGRFVFTQARANTFARGYYDQEGRIWSQAGTLLATTQQLVWYRD